MQRFRSRRKDEDLGDRLIQDGDTAGGAGSPNAASSGGGYSFRGDDVNALRVVHLLDPERNAPFGYADNSIQTAKYSLVPLSLHFVLYKNLFEQFQKAANLYFLGVSIMQVIPGLSPTGQYTTLLPLVIVVFLSFLKDFWEDWKRRIADRQVNQKDALVFRDDKWVTVKWVNVVVGDIVLVKKNEPFPADLVCFWSPEADGNCYIETASLDGETNLKLRRSTQGMFHQLAKCERDAEGIPQFRTRDLAARIVCELPNSRLYSFTGFFEKEGGRQPRIQLIPDNVLLRGSDLRNVKYILGAVIFTGEDSKLCRNMTAKHHKVSCMDKITNRQILYVFLFQVVLSAICTIGYSITVDDVGDRWYLPGPKNSSASGALQFITFLILFNSFIPISLYIMMEVVKLTQASLVNNDIQLYDPSTDTAAVVRNSKINEEFGQVEYIFSDKTGTLTCNKMEFRRFSVARADPNTNNNNINANPTLCAVGYGDTLHHNDPTVKNTSNNHSTTSPSFAGSFSQKPPRNSFQDPRISNGAWCHEPNREDIRRLFEAMAVCHTVIPEREGTKLVYQASSPDEGCLVAAARSFGIELVARTERSITLLDVTDGQHHTWQILHTIEFTSARKCMSLVCRDPVGRLVVFTKGADNVIMGHLRQDPAQTVLYAQTSQLLNSFATDGLRTLVYAQSDISEDTFKRWKKKVDNVPYTDNRESRLDELAVELESDLQLIGSTAIEDRLQDDVPETIELLAKAGIKLWVLTGDKQETALNIAYACNLLTKDMGLFRFDDCRADTIRSALERFVSDVECAALEAGQDIGLIIEGSMLDHILPKRAALQAARSNASNAEVDLPSIDEDEFNTDLFVSLAIKCKSVICCRVSPIQKAQIVEAVKVRVNGVTLSIGDGANDVSMIQMAHVGIGISGMEGLQAARVSDCSISQFRFLQRLLLVHGRWNYRRIARLIIFTFYKNVTLYMTQFWFAFYNQFSGQSLYDSWALSLYNLAFTALPIMSLAIFDKDVEAKRVTSTMQFPELYMDGIKGRMFNTSEFWKYAANSLLQSLICFFLTLYAAWDLVDVDSGVGLGITGHAVVAYSIVLNVVTLKCALEVNTWTIFNALVFFLSIFFWYLFLIVYCSLYEYVNFGDFATWYGADTMVLGHPCYWIIQLVVVVAALLRDVSYKYYRKQYEPRLFHVVQEFENKVGSFHRIAVKRETPWLFPKQELKVFKPTLKQSPGSDLAFYGENGAINGEEMADLAGTASLADITFQSTFYSPKSSSPGRRRQKISEIIDSDDI